MAIISMIYRIIAIDEAYQGAAIFMVYALGCDTISFSLALTESVYRPKPSLEKLKRFTPAGLLTHSSLPGLIEYS